MIEGFYILVHICRASYWRSQDLGQNDRCKV